MSHRATKYSTAVKALLDELGHATNKELLLRLNEDYSGLSATTVHRITVRLYEEGAIRRAPSRSDNELRYDANSVRHDHFMCERCGMLRDTVLGEDIRRQIEATVGDGCSISGDLTVSGVCKYCRSRG